MEGVSFHVQVLGGEGWETENSFLLPFFSSLHFVILQVGTMRSYRSSSALVNSGSTRHACREPIISGAYSTTISFFSSSERGIWGINWAHGTWLANTFPLSDILCLQLSFQYACPGLLHGSVLASIREVPLSFSFLAFRMRLSRFKKCFLIYFSVANH